MSWTSKIARFTPRITFNGGNNHLSRKTLQAVRDPRKGLRVATIATEAEAIGTYDNKVVKDVVSAICWTENPGFSVDLYALWFVWVAEFFKCGLAAVARTKCHVAGSNDTQFNLYG